MEMKTERSVEALFDGLSSPRGTGDVASKGPFFVTLPCAVENEDITIKTAEQLKEITSMLGLLFIFKSSYRKANRSSG